MSHPPTYPGPHQADLTTYVLFQRPKDLPSVRPGMQLTMTQPSNAYVLTIRQEPERAKVVGQKEKDRKAIDPPPIIQLQIRDPSDPAQNYLQSPYYFMCCTLLDSATETQAETVSSTALGGTLVSSLHRLKDVDNHDGGFFVFGDLSVKKEGEYRLRFSLFEMRKTEVVYIKSELSQVFTVFSSKDFPGMTESTFLSRSFGDQGVRLRIRKEPRTLLKRPLPLTSRSHSYGDNPREFSYSHTEYIGYSEQYQHEPHRRSHHEASSDYSSPPRKRPRMSASRESYDQEQRHGPYSAYAASYYPGGSQSSTFTHGPKSAPSAHSDHSYEHQRANSSATSSPYVSPHTDMPSYTFAPSQIHPQSQAREVFNYQQSHHTDMQYRQIPQLVYPIPPMRPDPLTRPPRVEPPVALPQPAARASSLAQPYVHQATPLPHRPEETVQPSAEAPPSASEPPLIQLPPLHSTVSSQTQGTAPQLHSSNVIPRIESLGPDSITRHDDLLKQEDTPEVQPPNTRPRS